MGDSITVRTLDRSFGPQMTVLNRACPIGADFTFLFHRGEDFFRWPELVYDAHRYAGLMRGDTLRGYLMSGFYSGWDGARVGTLGYVGDARVLAEERGARLTEVAADYLRERMPPELDLAFCLVKRGNLPADRVVRTARQGGWDLRHLSGFEVMNLLLLRPVRPAGVVRVRHAALGDLEAMAALLGRVNGRRPLAHLPSAEDLARFFRERPGYDLSRAYLAESGGRLLGCLVAWDMWEVHRTEVLSYPPLFSALRRIWPLASLSLDALGALPLVGPRLPFRLPPLPAPGEAFRSLTVTQLAVEDGRPEVLRDLLAALFRDHLGASPPYHMVHLGLVSADPLRAALRGLPGQRFVSDIHAILRLGSHADRGFASLGRPCVDLQFI